jgi:hypothetical protein
LKLTDAILIKKAKEISQVIIKRASTVPGAQEHQLVKDLDGFLASKGWLDRFKKRNGLVGPELIYMCAFIRLNLFIYS